MSNLYGGFGINLGSAGGGGGANTLNIELTSIVTDDGDDATGEVGNWKKPFATIYAAEFATYTEAKAAGKRGNVFVFNTTTSESHLGFYNITTTCFRARIVIDDWVFISDENQAFAPKAESISGYRFLGDATIADTNGVTMAFFYPYSYTTTNVIIETTSITLTSGLLCISDQVDISVKINATEFINCTGTGDLISDSGSTFDFELILTTPVFQYDNVNFLNITGSTGEKNLIFNIEQIVSFNIFGSVFVQLAGFVKYVGSQFLVVDPRTADPVPATVTATVGGLAICDMNDLHSFVFNMSAGARYIEMAGAVGGGGVLYGAKVIANINTGNITGAVINLSQPGAALEPQVYLGDAVINLSSNVAGSIISGKGAIYSRTSVLYSPNSANAMSGNLAGDLIVRTYGQLYANLSSTNISVVVGAVSFDVDVDYETPRVLNLFTS